MTDRVRESLVFAHQEWIGFVQPVGLVVSPSVMVDAQVAPDRNIAGRQRDFRDLLEEQREGVTTRWRLKDPRELFINWLNWEDSDLVNADCDREALEISLPELQVILSATWAVPADDDSDIKWKMLIRAEEPGANLDKSPELEHSWNATRHERFERLLRETGIPIGILCNDECIRLIYAPAGESSGHITFDVSQMAEVAGRPILSAFEMLLSADALFMGSLAGRLPSLLVKSREAQAEVSTRLSRQVLAALYELLRGFVAAEARNGDGALTDLAHRHPERLYGGLITALMRLVFVLYAEDRGMMSDHPVYQQHYSLGGLFAKLRKDAAAWPDTMDQRFGAWAHLLSLFRLTHGGGRHAGLSFVGRSGGLFDPDRFRFLEGRGQDGGFRHGIPMVPDGTVWKILQSLMVLDGERLSYRTLDVEQIGSVYEAIMGFRVEVTSGRSIAVRSQKRTGAAVNVNLEGLLEVDSRSRVRTFQDLTDQRLTSNEGTALRNAWNPPEIVAAIDRKIDRDATPNVLPANTPVLQPTDERRRSGSHYTPRSLTEPIVSEALRPILERLGPSAKPSEILDLKVLDPATGSGAFLVEACRQLSARLVEAWSIHGRPSTLTLDDDEQVHARRLVAQQCLYGVDKNPMAIDLARLSLWLATFARDHEFTFIDHALRHGDSLVGLTRRQIEGFHWKADSPRFQVGVEAIPITGHVMQASELRRTIRRLGDNAPQQVLLRLMNESDHELESVRRFGDLVLTAFFEGDRPKARDIKLREFANLITHDEADDLRVSLGDLEPPLAPFHWEIEFPEVFERENPGFDVIVGNPPFQGGRNVSANLGPVYSKWLTTVHESSSGGADLVAHFFRRAFSLLRQGATFGLIATNTIGQGDTRSTGLRWICQNGGEIYAAQRRIKWPGEAAVVVSVVHVYKGIVTVPKRLDGRPAGIITAFLFHSGGHDDPERLKTNNGKSFQGSIVLGMGFTFDDADKKGVATPISEMYRLIDMDSRYQSVIFPYIGGQEVNTSPTHSHRRYVIDFGERDERDCRENWPELLEIVERNVKPERITKDGKKYPRMVFEWWKYWNPRIELRSAVSDLDRVIVINCGATPHHAFTFLPARMVFANTLAVFPINTYSAFCALQSLPHEIWTRFFGSSLEERLRYTPSDCFETFPFPKNWDTRYDLGTAGKEYYRFRAGLMVSNREGLTKTYNRFHDPGERSPGIIKLRALHGNLDRAVLNAYGWSDIAVDCEFLLDYEIDENEWGKRRKPWRYRWPDDVRDEVLARLMALNAERALEERLAGPKSHIRKVNL